MTKLLGPSSELTTSSSSLFQRLSISLIKTASAIRNERETVVNLAVTVVTEKNALAKLNNERGPRSSVCAANFEILLGRVKMMEG